MKISSKLVASFVGVSTLTSLVGIVAIIQSQKIAETLAIAEAENVAQVIATSIGYRLGLIYVATISSQTNIMGRFGVNLQSVRGANLWCKYQLTNLNRLINAQLNL
jgi:uncharacterized protein YebE (UPF0316 family)